MCCCPLSPTFTVFLLALNFSFSHSDSLFTLLTNTLSLSICLPSVSSDHQTLSYPLHHVLLFLTLYTLSSSLSPFIPCLPHSLTLTYKGGGARSSTRMAAAFSDTSLLHSSTVSKMTGTYVCTAITAPCGTSYLCYCPLSPTFTIFPLSLYFSLSQSHSLFLYS